MFNSNLELLFSNRYSIMGNEILQALVDSNRLRASDLSLFQDCSLVNTGRRSNGAKVLNTTCHYQV